MKLSEYNFPADIKHMTQKELEQLADEIREFLIDKVSVTGGHLASNLGVVELTLALHKVFDSPKDKMIWDVGHQAYVHKILTGRAQGFDTLRMFDGLSGFPRRSESEHDHFNAGHSSTSVSVAYGMAKARDLEGEDHAVVAVIGDGALTGGVAFEALNNAGHAYEDKKKTKLIIILNDNEMSIHKNIGGLTQHLSNLRSAPGYNNFKRNLKEFLHRMPVFGFGAYKVLESIRDAVKNAVIPDGVFEGFGFKYLGPIDGHDMQELSAILEGAKKMEGPVVIHAITKKGKGYPPAEKNPDTFHGIGPFNPLTGLSEANAKPTYSKIFGNRLTLLAKENKRIVAISAAMVEAVGLAPFKEQYPDRLYDVAIAEQHAVDFAAGLAIEGYHPVVAIYSTFLQRAYDQILIDICAQNLPVIFCLDRAGNVGNDGETHHGIYDISYLTHMPGMTVLSPKDGKELEQMLTYALEQNGPVAIRYPRGAADDLSGEGEEQPIDGKIEVLRAAPEDSVCILALGRMAAPALKAADLLRQRGQEAAVVNARFAKPLDKEGILALRERYALVATLEDNTVAGGFGTCVAQLFAENKLPKTNKKNTLFSRKANKDKSFMILGWPDQIIKQGSVAQLEEQHGLSAQAIAERIRQKTQEED